MANRHTMMGDLDCSILYHLCKNSRASTTEIAQKLGVRIFDDAQSNQPTERIMNHRAVQSSSIRWLSGRTSTGINIESAKIAVINQLQKIDDVVEVYELLELRPVHALMCLQVYVRLIPSASTILQAWHMQSTANLRSTGERRCVQAISTTSLWLSEPSVPPIRFA